MDAISGRCKEVIQKHTDYVRALAVHDGLVVSGGDDKRIIVWVCTDVLCLMVPFDGALWCFIVLMVLFSCALLLFSMVWSCHAYTTAPCSHTPPTHPA